MLEATYYLIIYYCYSMLTITDTNTKQKPFKSQLMLMIF
ncbi:hypothetical protein PAGA_a2509 [Pseudoalteromonas agarivorans DSM 14585]|uniref:Uncharacterized protein n=1 Tax=Pseudoalteromonas agarivorans DSM 14585 TaxID=1312369 RepID=A0ACA8DYB8_9GAMM|nr:hypothetical protein PAGA_a2509 [Pseudoalteromonas agarivorans DSM 14585]